MAKKKEEAPKTFKPMPEVEVVEVKKASKKKVDNAGLLAGLLTIEGVTEEMAGYIVQSGVPDDSHVVQTYYRVSALTADAIIKVMKESTPK